VHDRWAALALAVAQSPAVGQGPAAVLALAAECPAAVPGPAAALHAVAPSQAVVRRAAGACPAAARGRAGASLEVAALAQEAVGWRAAAPVVLRRDNWRGSSICQVLVAPDGRAHAPRRDRALAARWLAARWLVVRWLAVLRLTSSAISQQRAQAPADRVRAAIKLPACLDAAVQATWSDRAVAERVLVAAETVGELALATAGAARAAVGMGVVQTVVAPMVEEAMDAVRSPAKVAVARVAAMATATAEAAGGIAATEACVPIGPAAAIGPTIDPTAFPIATSGTIGAKTISRKSITTGETIGEITAAGTTTIGGTIIPTTISISAPT
jgi:hypothetical protein